MPASAIPVSSTTLLSLGAHGQLQGVNLANGVRRFTNVPYALPPIGERRWKKPTPLPADYAYGEPRDCTEFGAICPQPEYIISGKKASPLEGAKISEDCLVLNIWVPEGQPPAEGWPVLVWIHGGWLQIGNPSLDEHYQPSQLIAIDGSGASLQAVVISIGYRLNIFGFLAGDGIEGNFGFWDQRLALEWIQEHIRFFGGDPSRVTLGGLSAGAYSVNVQLQYELLHTDGSRPLFKNAWMVSNAIPTQPKLIAEANRQLENVYAIHSIPTHLSTSSKLEALRAIPSSTLISRLFDLDLHTFRAVTDNALIHSTMISQFYDGTFASLFRERGFRVLIGEVEHEERMYGGTNPPETVDREALLKGLENYYPREICEALLNVYPSPFASGGEKGTSLPEVQKLFGLITSDAQVRAPIRGFCARLIDGGVPLERVARYRIGFRPKCFDDVWDPEMGVTHSYDMATWWFNARYGYTEAEKAGVRAWLEDSLIPLVNFAEQWPGWQAKDMKEYRRLCEDAKSESVVDKDWERLLKVAGVLSGR